MCGRFNATFDKGLRKLYTRLEINKIIDRPIDTRFAKAADTISIIRNMGNNRQVESAQWWLLLTETDNSFKPSKYTSFNTRFDKLDTEGSAGYQAYRQSRCIIAVKGFGETEFVNKKPVHYFDMTAQDGGLLLGGLCREWVHSKTSELKLSCSIITLPPHPKLKHIHSKAMPLILPQEKGLIDSWLSTNVTDTQQFSSLLFPHIPQALIAQRIDKPSSYQAIGEEELII
jgi:putative SOS response-associated peptidase YedK